jgi:orotate phosphoribosyltransferase
MHLDDFTVCGAHQHGHFLLSSGLHSADYLQCALFLARPDRAEDAGRQLAAGLQEAAVDPDVVVAPAMGGLIIGHEVARALGKPFLFTERENGEMTLRRGFALAPGQSVVIIEDVVTTGRSTLEVASILEGQKAKVLGIASIVNRTGTENPFAPLPYRCLVEVSFPTWDPNDCPLCGEGVPIAKPGSRPIA